MQSLDAPRSSQNSEQNDTPRSSSQNTGETIDAILTVKMLSDYLHCHPSTIYRLTKRKAIPAFRVGSDWRFHKAAIDKWVKLKMIEPST